MRANDVVRSIVALGTNRDRLCRTGTKFNVLRLGQGNFRSFGSSDCSATTEESARGTTPNGTRHCAAIETCTRWTTPTDVWD